jgi:protein-tyrosine-phosphatase
MIGYEVVALRTAGHLSFDAAAVPHETSLHEQRSPDLPHAVLFACNLNAIRSPMAAAILRHLAGKRIYVRSAGVRPGEVDPFAIMAMDEIGIDIAKHQPRAIEELADTSFDLIISLAPEAHHKALELTRTMAVDVEYWPTMDPSGPWSSALRGNAPCGSWRRRAPH